MAKLMTEGAVVRGLSGRVAIHTESHAGGNFFGQDFVLIDRPVTRGTLHAHFQVARVTEEDKVRDPVYSHPFYLFSPLAGFYQLLDLRTIAHC